MLEDEKIEELEFPRTYDKCPACGCEETIARRVKDEEVAKGRMKAGVNAALARSVTPMLDPEHALALTRAPLLVSLFDACVRCGNYYCVRADKTEGIIKPSPGPGPQPMFPPGGHQLPGGLPGLEGFQGFIGRG